MVITTSWVGVAVVDFFWGETVRIHFLHGNKSFTLHSISNSRTQTIFRFLQGYAASYMTSGSGQVVFVGVCVCVFVFLFLVGTEEILPPSGSMVKSGKATGIRSDAGP